MTTKTTKQTHLYDDQIFAHHGIRFRVQFPFDEFTSAPWEDCDGHGIVSEWTTRDKAPGERVLVTDRSSRRYYDVRATLAIARRDSWGVANPPTGASKRQIAALAVEHDYQYLRGWCNDEWHYCGVVVTREDTGEDRSIWGIEDTEGAYLAETAYELADELIAVGRARMLPREAARMLAPWPDAL